MSITRSSTPLQLASARSMLASSATLAINEAVAARRAAGRSTIHLGFGEATLPLHPLLAEALARAAKQTSYTPVTGIPPLRAAIADYLIRTRRIASAPDSIIIAPGSKPLLYALLQVLDGDLLLPTPSWVSYAPHARLAGRRVISVETDRNDHHRLSPETLTAAYEQARRDGADPRILIVNTPSNPTAQMFAQEDVETLANWCRERGITIISDEIYAELAHGWRPHISPAQCYPEGTIVTGGLSKAFAAGGWRLGYAALPTTPTGKQLLTALRALASEIWSSATTPVQIAAVTAYSPSAELDAHVRRSARLHGLVSLRLYEMLLQLGVTCPRPAGGFYLYPDFAPYRAALQAKGISTSDDLARRLLDEWDIATLPGTAFGEGPGALRLRMATSMLYVPETVKSDEEREQVLWDLLDKIDRLDEGKGMLDIPELAKAQERLAEFVQSLS